MINEITRDADKRMVKSVEALKAELKKLRTGRAHPSLLEHIKINYYDVETPLSQVASITVDGPRALTITPWEKQMVQVIEKAIRNSDLGLNPATAGMAIRVPLPALTEERRRDLIRVVKEEVEKAKVAIRNVRRDAINDFKELLKEKDISEDDERRAQNEMQKLTDKYVNEVDKVFHAKEVDLMEV